jgi:hypothetical protein
MAKAFKDGKYHGLGKEDDGFVDARKTKGKRERRDKIMGKCFH